MHIEIPKKKIARSDKDVFHFLIHVENFEKLIPENRADFEVVDEKTFKFILKGMPEIVLRLEEHIPTQKVVFGAASGKLPFTLTASITPLGDNESEVGLSFKGQFNPLMASMIKKPITHFMEILSANLKHIG